jgi:hypothetical protein
LNQCAAAVRLVSSPHSLFPSSVIVRLFNCDASFTEKENDKKSLATIRAQIEVDKRERAQKAAQEKVLRDGTSTAPGADAATASAAAPATSSLPGREFSETRLQIRLTSGGAPITTTLRSEASCVPLFFPYRFAFSDRPSSVF